MSWNPLFRSLLTSSVLHKGPVVVAVWSLFMASADRNGESDLTEPFVASILQTPIAEVEAAFKILESPDPHSRTTEHEGRRIIKRQDGRWFLPSHSKHREMASKEMAAVRQSRYRARKAAAEAPAVCAHSSGCQSPAVGVVMGFPACSEHAFIEQATA